MHCGRGRAKSKVKGRRLKVEGRRLKFGRLTSRSALFRLDIEAMVFRDQLVVPGKDHQLRAGERCPARLESASPSDQRRGEHFLGSGFEGESMSKLQRGAR